MRGIAALAVLLLHLGEELGSGIFHSAYLAVDFFFPRLGAEVPSWQRKIVSMIRSAGAAEVHLRISSPPTIGPCRYGIDTPTREELIASNHNTDQIRKFIEADSLGYLSIEGLYESVEGVAKPASGGGPQGFCDACFSGKYPIADEKPARLRQLRLISA